MKSCRQYCQDYWQRIIREQQDEVQTLIGLPYPYLVPNHQMFQEMYYWDTYFMCLGVVDSPLKYLIEDCTNNLLYLYERFGRIPNTTRYYHLSRSQPPFLSSMMRIAWPLIKDDIHGTDWLRSAYRVAKSEYKTVWNGLAFPDDRLVEGLGLSRYYDIDIWHDAAEAESGWDMTPRFEDRCLDFCPIDLNSILARYATDLQYFARELGLEKDASFWQKEFENRKKSIYRYCKGPDGFFYDYDFINAEQSTFKSIAGFFPLWAGVLSQEDAEIAAKAGLNALEMSFGVVTTEEWHPKSGEVAKQWAWPNGWAPLHWITVSGLNRYGLVDDAKRVAGKWVEVVERVFAAEGKNFEKYNVVEGGRSVPDRYPDQEGFGWTNAVYLRLKDFVESDRPLD